MSELLSDVESIDEKPAATPIASGLAFSGLAQVRNTEAQLRWQGFQSSIQLNIIGWAGIAAWLINSSNNQQLLLAMLASAGAILGNVIHYKILGRDGKFMGLWNESLIALERANRIQGGVEVFSSARYEELRTREPTMQWILRSCVILFIVTWVVVSVVALFSLSF